MHEAETNNKKLREIFVFLLVKNYLSFCLLKFNYKL